MTVANNFFIVEAFAIQPQWLEYSYESFNQFLHISTELGYSIILYQNFIPISLVITQEIVKSIQSWLIYQDIELYHHGGDRTIPRNWNVADELGQISHIFSDKTGTLTQNVMEFKSCGVGGSTHFEIKSKSEYASSQLKKELLDSKSPYHERLNQLFLCISLCHTVLVQIVNTKRVYKSQSPDESALIEASKQVGYELIERSNSIVKLKILGQAKAFELLHILEFTSSRKRMSIIVKDNGKIFVFCKGADSVIYDLLLPDQEQFIAEVNDQVEKFAGDGLRTLGYGFKELSDSAYNEFLVKYRRAINDVQNRTSLLEVAFEEVERGLNLIGATGIEDKLQDGVCDSVRDLLTAGIKIWVLTGDKIETAINIGYSCSLLSINTTLLIIRGPSNLTVDDHGTTIIQVENCFKIISTSAATSFSLIIDGRALNAVFGNESNSSRFLELCEKCDAVVCCRTSPKQKASVVNLVKAKNKITLAVGDGANDVGMIQAAHIGVGIAGEEGMQAAMAADYVIGQFRFLSRLLLVQGRWCYFRMASFLPNFFFKVIIYK
jgi:phospholipid-translocating ATPase